MRTRLVGALALIAALLALIGLASLGASPAVAADETPIDPAAAVDVAQPADTAPATDEAQDTAPATATPVAGSGAGQTAVRGALVAPDRKPVANVAIKVTNTSAVTAADGAVTAVGGFVQETRTGADGTWRVELPGGGRYDVALAQDTLPPGISLANSAQSSRNVNVLAGDTSTVLFKTSTGEAPDEGAQPASNRALQLALDGVLFGLIIALAAIGLSLIFGTTGLTNFSHGELVTLGALVAYFFNAILHLPFILAAALSVLVCGVLGGIQDRLLWRKLRKRGTGLIAMLVVSIGFGILLRYVFLFFFGGATRQFDAYGGQAGIQVGPVVITPKAAIGAVVAIVFLLATAFWLLRSRSGKASRAISDNPALASASGIDVERVINQVWIFGAALAALAGILYSLNNGVSWIEGFQLLLLVFAGVTLGGLGTAFGAIIGSLIVGVMIQVSTVFVPPELKNVGALVILIVILLIRPQGILGRRERVG